MLPALDVEGFVESFDLELPKLYGWVLSFPKKHQVGVLIYVSGF